MEEMLEHLAEYVALAVNMVAILGIAVGSLEALIGLVRLTTGGDAPARVPAFELLIPAQDVGSMKLRFFG